MSGGLDPFNAKKLLRRLQEAGNLRLTRAAEEELRRSALCVVDCINVIRCGAVAPPEWERGTWRYSIRTPRMTVLVELDEEAEMFTIITARRNQS